MFARVGEDSLRQFGRQILMDCHPPFQDRMALRMCVSVRMMMPLCVSSLCRRHSSHDLTRQRSFVGLLDFEIVAIGDGAAGGHG